MRHIVYEDPIAHKFAIVRLPSRYVEGGKLPVPRATRWFATREEALATLPDLFDEDEGGCDEDVLH